MTKDWKGGKASVFKTIGASNHADHERADADYYATEPAATDWLCKIEKFKSPILEPSCGEGHISRQLIANGYDVVSRDLVDRGYGEVRDFLFFNNEQWDGDIITNPPYAAAQEFVEQALKMIHTGRKVAMFLKLTFLEGQGRAELFRRTPPHPRVGQPIKTEMRHERRLRQHQRLRNSLRMVHLGERLHRTPRNQMVQLVHKIGCVFHDSTREGSLYIHILIVSSFVYCILFFQPVRATFFIHLMLLFKTIISPQRRAPGRGIYYPMAKPLWCRVFDSPPPTT